MFRWLYYQWCTCMKKYTLQIEYQWRYGVKQYLENKEFRITLNYSCKCLSNFQTRFTQNPLFLYLDDPISITYRSIWMKFGMPTGEICLKIDKTDLINVSFCFNDFFCPKICHFSKMHNLHINYTKTKLIIKNISPPSCRTGF